MQADIARTSILIEVDFQPYRVDFGQFPALIVATRGGRRGDSYVPPESAAYERVLRAARADASRAAAIVGADHIQA